MQKIILATNNTHKIEELSTLLQPMICVSQQTLGVDAVEETGLSFVENALLKARHASGKTQRPALADDSGLVVPALQGAPGIYSSRYAGLNANDAENIQLLLERMISFKGSDRQAYFYCAIVLLRYPSDPTPLIACGRLDGLISEQLQGTNGFGYDPVFYLPAQDCSMAELKAEEKNKISHRARALQVLKSQFKLEW